MGYLFWTCWAVKSHKPPNIINYCTNCSWYPLELDGKTSLLKILHPYVIKHGKMKLACTWKLHPTG